MFTRKSAILPAILVTLVITSNSTSCPPSLAIDISDGELLDNLTIKYEEIFYDPSNYWVYQDNSTSDRTVLGCLCDVTVCVRKCCYEGEKMINMTCQEFQSNSTYSIDIYDDTRLADPSDIPDFSIVYGRSCPEGLVSVLVDLNIGDKMYLQVDGTLYVPGFHEEIKTVDKYCIDQFDDDFVSDEITALVCIPQGEVDGRVFTTHIVVGMIISMPFLLATFIAYALLPDRNLHMKALMSYVINLMFGYLLLVIIQLSKSKFDTTSCIVIGYLCLFFFLVSFFWMNVICIDIWFAFSGLRGFSGSKSAERRRFLWYCAYAWGMSILHVVVVFIIDSTSKDMAWYDPGIGNGQCFVKINYPELLYFYGPMGFLITINVVLFAITAIKIRRIKKDTSVLKKDENKRHSYENDKQKFNLYLKLLFAMGVNWSLEIISWAVNWKIGHVPPYIWYLTDFCNAIYGVFIFFIFVFKKSIWKLLKKRYYSFTGRTHLAHSMTQNQTRTTSYSTAHNNSSVNNGTMMSETNMLRSEV